MDALSFVKKLSKNFGKSISESLNNLQQMHLKLLQKSNSQNTKNNL